MISRNTFPDPPARLHFIGLKGMAMTALAEILQRQGYSITGSDTTEVFQSDNILKNLNIYCASSFDSSHLSRDTDAVIYSTAYTDKNIERIQARRIGVTEWSCPEVMGMLLSAHSNSIAVAGSHGKTTTTALLARMLEEGGLDPTALVGSRVNEWGSNARLGQSQWFVLEADEYQNKFLYYRPRYLIITNIDYDHPDFFKDKNSYNSVFIDFVSRLPSDGSLIIWQGEPLLPQLRLVCPAKIITYGEEKNSDWQISAVTVDEERTKFEIKNKGRPSIKLSSPLPGLHYALDATAALVMADMAGARLDNISQALERYRGAARRCEPRGEWRGALIIDDYAHHPTEVRATLMALKQKYPARRLWCVFHPHTFSRTAALFNDFVESLNMADQAIILPIYASAREKDGNINSEKLVEKINSLSAHKAIASSSIDDAVIKLRSLVCPNDVVVTMGAGDVWRVADKLLANV